MVAFAAPGRLAVVLAAFLALPFSAPVAADPLAKTVFGSQRLPAATEPRVYGFYSKGCFAGGLAIARDGPHWQAMRLSRNRRWGHPATIALIERLSREAVQDGWPGLLIGDISQPRGGPMLSGHASHQIGLDADIWFMPMPSRRLSEAERESLGAQSLIREGSLHVDERRWTPAHAALLRRAASYPEVERIFVHPGIKKKLCDSVTGDRSWLRKVRPFWGHDSHFHIRLQCPDGSRSCREQAPVPAGEGCDKSLAWWFTEEPWRPAKGPQKPRARDVMRLSALPTACRQVLEAPAPASEAAVTVGGGGIQVTGQDAPAPVAANAFAPPLPADSGVPLPSPRPAP
jgi:penicillin-insensitive murein endopeptidase